VAARDNRAMALDPARHRAASSTWRTAVVVVAIVACAAATLAAMGRPLTYRHGPVRLWSGDVNGDQNSQQIADPYTFTHLTHGALLYALLAATARRRPLGVRLIAAVALECGWEVLENTDVVIRRYRERTIALGYYGDSVINSVGDVAAAIAGFLVTAALPVPVTVAAVLALETGLMFWIHDSLLLNVVMLVHPIAAVRDWQSAAGP